MTDDSSQGALLPDEAKLVFLTAGPDAVDARIRARLQRPLDWEQLLILAEWERSLPWSWRRLRALGAAPSPEIAVALDRVSTVSEFRGLMLRERLLEMLRLCKEHGVPVVMLKGAGLAMTSYASFGDRPMGDLDLLVAPDDAERLWQLAIEHGWAWDAQAFPKDHYLSHHHLPPLFDQRRTGAKLEIHTALNMSGHPFALSFHEARKAGRRASGLDGEVYVLDAAHMIVHLAVHFAWAHLASFGLWRLARDLRALTRGGVDWDAVAAVAGRYQAQSAVFWSYRLVDLLAGGHDAPEAFLRGLRRPRTALLEGLIERHLSSHVVSRIVPCPSERWRRLLWSLALEPAKVGEGRPWDEDPLVHAGAQEPLSQLARFRGQLAHLGEWGRYLSGVTRAGSGV